jgi:hypothetical protein
LKTSAAGKPWTSVNVAVGDGGEVQWRRLAVHRESLPEPESRQGRNALKEATSTCPFYQTISMNSSLRAWQKA